MKEVTTIGVDLAKSVFQVHGVDTEGAVVVCRQLRRSQVLPFFSKLRRYLVGIEACSCANAVALRLYQRYRPRADISARVRKRPIYSREDGIPSFSTG